jgi:hypothetical protein
MWLCHRSQVAQVEWESSITVANPEENPAGKLHGTAVGVSQIHNSSSVLVALHQISGKKRMLSRQGNC